jgi:hypothetical protein
VRTNSQRDRNVRQASFPRSPRAVLHTPPRGVTLKTERAQSVHQHDAPNGVTHSATAAAPISTSTHRTLMSSDSEDSDSARSHITDGAAAVSTHGTAAQRHSAAHSRHSAPRTQSAPLTARLSPSPVNERVFSGTVAHRGTVAVPLTAHADATVARLVARPDPLLLWHAALSRRTETSAAAGWRRRPRHNRSGVVAGRAAARAARSKRDHWRRVPSGE